MPIQSLIARRLHGVQSEDVKQRLDALFHGKCAYCESFFAAVSPVDIEHYRPKGAVAEKPDHKGYWWLAMAWDNLLPSCIDCNRKRKQIVVEPDATLKALYKFGRSGPSGQSGKKDSFPIAGAAYAMEDGEDLLAEQPLLLNPCRDRPDDHLSFPIDENSTLALLFPDGPKGRSVRGETSIQVYGLNRLGLVQSRTRLLPQVRFLGTQVVELGEILDALEAPAVAAALPEIERNAIADKVRTLQDRTLDEMCALAAPSAPYSALAAAWLRLFRRHAEGAVPALEEIAD